MGNISYIYNQNKGGIAGALNKGINALIASGCEFFYTFDQDSIFDISYFNKMNNFRYQENAEIICPDFYDVNSKTHGMFIQLGRWGYSDVRGKKTASFAITSGMGISKMHGIPLVSLTSCILLIMSILSIVYVQLIRGSIFM